MSSIGLSSLALNSSLLEDSQLLGYKGKGVVLNGINDLILLDKGVLAFFKVRNLKAEEDLYLRYRLRKFGIRIFRFRSRDVQFVLNLLVNTCKLPLYKDIRFIFQGNCFFIPFSSYDFFIYFMQVFSSLLSSGSLNCFSFKEGSQIFLINSSYYYSLSGLIKFNQASKERVAFNFYLNFLFSRNIFFSLLYLKYYNSIYNII